MYLISGYCPRTDISMGCHGFSIILRPEVKERVAASQITQEQIDYLLENSGRAWLDSCGYDRMFDPDNYGPFSDPKKPPGPNARRSYEPRMDLRVAWGEWGPEHITVPGNACGLDIARETLGSPFDDAVWLHPHNVDCWRQKSLLLIVFTEIMELIVWRSLRIADFTPTVSAEVLPVED